MAFGIGERVLFMEVSVIQECPDREGISLVDVRGYSTKQNPHGVFLILSRPIMTLLTSPHIENSSYSCSSLV